MKLFRTAVPLLLFGWTQAWAQPSTVIQIDVENYAYYYADNPDYTKFATVATATPPAATNTFASLIGLADIVRVNGKAAKGTWSIRATHVNFSPTATAGQTIADTSRRFVTDWIWEIQQADGTPVGAIMATGLGFGPPPPGAPLGLSPTAGSSMAIVGGTGAFLGIKGQAGFSAITTTGRGASQVEDPSMRRALGGGSRSFLLQLIPTAQAKVLNGPSGPLILHGKDFNYVSIASPAKNGEVLTLLATNLGPTAPGVNPRQPFPSSPLSVVASPVEVLVNGQAASVLYAGGYPGATDAYQINIQLPTGLAAGVGTLQINSAWLQGDTFPIAIQ